MNTIFNFNEGTSIKAVKTKKMRLGKQRRKGMYTYMEVYYIPQKFVGKVTDNFKGPINFFSFLKRTLVDEIVPNDSA